MNPIFNSFDTKYKNPIGAVRETTNVHFKIILDKKIYCRKASLVLLDDTNNKTSYYSMFWCGDLQDNLEAWECDFTPLHTGLFRYYFEIDTDNSRFPIVRDICGIGKPGEFNKIDKWQLTVYKKEYSTPSWIKGGIMYQIFPDRFFRSNTKKVNIPKDRVIRDDWGGEPVSSPNEHGEVTNSDYFCGDLNGITLKLDYLKNLGVTCIYLNPIFEAHSNHRYNTADYSKIDPLLGDEEDFKNLCKKAYKKGIRIILDGVFSHTGSDSIYFNKSGRYPFEGAYNSRDSKYYNWYKFLNWPNKYRAWWNFETLPELNKEEPSYQQFVFNENGIIRKWLRLGASGWRLDVADELSDEFIEKIRLSSKAEKEESLIIGEVWEDASNKISYSKKRKYLFGTELDSVMNYPFMNAIISFIKGADAANIMDSILTIVENYPKPTLDSLMNSLSTHDTKRILSVLDERNIADSYINTININSGDDEHTFRLLSIAVSMQYTLPGVPCIFYGDEAGVYGGRDPFCRSCYPWGNENYKLVDFYKKLGRIRSEQSAFAEGDFIPYVYNKNFISYMRKNKNNCIMCMFNMNKHVYKLDLPSNIESYSLLLGDTDIINKTLFIKPESFAILRCL